MKMKIDSHCRVIMEERNYVWFSFCAEHKTSQKRIWSVIFQHTYFTVSHIFVRRWGNNEGRWMCLERALAWWFPGNLFEELVFLLDPLYGFHQRAVSAGFESKKNEIKNIKCLEFDIEGYCWAYCRLSVTVTGRFAN